MIKVKESLFETLLKQGITQAKTSQTTPLVSLTEKIDDIDPIIFFEAAKLLEKDRSFWSSTAEDFYIVGVGNALEISAEESRFQSIEKQWEDCLENAVIHNPDQVPGTGVLALGGMSFDPQHEQSKLWEAYPTSQFIVPQYMLTKSKEQYYFTTTWQVTASNDPATISCEIDQDKRLLFASDLNLPTGAVVLGKEEIGVDQWLKIVDQAIEEIKHEQVKKIVLAREMRLSLDKPAEIGVMLQKLLHLQTDSYIFAIERGENCFIGATPERLVKLSGEKLLSACVAGTAPRGETLEEDEQISQALLTDDKNLEEHGYVVEMIRQAMEKHCTDIVIPEEPIIFPLKNLQHLYTPVTAKLTNNYSVFDVIKRLHPTPALGGEPTDESLAFIRKHELFERGWYGAPIGWLDSNKHAEFAVAIRSGLMQGNEASLFAGCGIMKDSDPILEYEETKIKFLPILSVLGEHDESH